MQIPPINEHLFCKYFVRLSVGNATKVFATYGCCHPCFFLQMLDSSLTMDEMDALKRQQQEKESWTNIKDLTKIGVLLDEHSIPPPPLINKINIRVLERVFPFVSPRGGL